MDFIQPHLLSPPSNVNTSLPLSLNYDHYPIIMPLPQTSSPHEVHSQNPPPSPCILFPIPTPQLEEFQTPFITQNYLNIHNLTTTVHTSTLLHLTQWEMAQEHCKLLSNPSVTVSLHITPPLSPQPRAPKMDFFSVHYKKSGNLNLTSAMLSRKPSAIP